MVYVSLGSWRNPKVNRPIGAKIRSAGQFGEAKGELTPLVARPLGFRV